MLEYACCYPRDGRENSWAGRCDRDVTRVSGGCLPSPPPLKGPSTEPDCVGVGRTPITASIGDPFGAVTRLLGRRPAALVTVTTAEARPSGRPASWGHARPATSQFT